MEMIKYPNDSDTREIVCKQPNTLADMSYVGYSEIINLVYKILGGSQYQKYMPSLLKE